VVGEEWAGGGVGMGCQCEDGGVGMEMGGEGDEFGCFARK